MEHRLLRSFVAVAEELHFSRAARRLRISQPPLSVQIRRLEDELGVTLFDRDRRNVALTPAGAALLGRARHLLAEAERATVEVQRVARGERGVLTIGYAATATHQVLPRLVPRFAAAHPDLRLELMELPSPAQAPALREERIELGLACVPVDAPDLVETPLVHERLFVALPRRHPLARRALVPARSLDGVPMVGIRADIEPSWAQASMRALRAAGAVPELVQETDTKIALLGLVAAGLGVSVVSESTVELGRRGVVYRPLAGLHLHLTLAALTPPAPTPRAAAFLELARAAFSRPRRAASPPV